MIAERCAACFAPLDNMGPRCTDCGGKPISGQLESVELLAAIDAEAQRVAAEEAREEAERLGRLAALEVRQKERAAAAIEQERLKGEAVALKEQLRVEAAEEKGRLRAAAAAEKVRARMEAADHRQRVKDAARAEKERKKAERLAAKSSGEGTITGCAMLIGIGMLLFVLIGVMAGS